jgi:hypothetical protein
LSQLFVEANGFAGRKDRRLSRSKKIARVDIEGNRQLLDSGKSCVGRFVLNEVKGGRLIAAADDKLQEEMPRSFLKFLAPLANNTGATSLAVGIDF